MDPQLPQIENRLQILERDYGHFKLHAHNKYDSNQVMDGDIGGRILSRWHSLPGTSAATAGNYGVFFIASDPCVITLFQEVHEVKGSDAGTVSLQLEKLTRGVAPDSGTVALAAALSLKATANIVQSATITSTTSAKTLAIGDRLCLKDAGVLTAVSGVTILLAVQLI